MKIVIFTGMKYHSILHRHVCVMGIIGRDLFVCCDINVCPNNALVICNHGPPTPGEGRGIAVEMSGVFTFALSPQCGGNTRDLCYIGKKGGAMKT